MKALYSTKPSAGQASFFYSLIVKTEGILDTNVVMCSVENANKVKKVMLYITRHLFFL